MSGLSVGDLVSESLAHYVTYEGSMTAPGCQETVTWIVLNKPLFITRQQASIGSIYLFQSTLTLALIRTTCQLVKCSTCY